MHELTTEAGFGFSFFNLFGSCDLEFSPCRLLKFHTVTINTTLRRPGSDRADRASALSFKRPINKSFHPGLKSEINLSFPGETRGPVHENFDTILLQGPRSFDSTLIAQYVF